MTIWNNADNPKWAALAKRTEPFIERLTDREDLAVVVAPDIRDAVEREAKPLPSGAFYPAFARINLNASLLFPETFEHIEYVDPNNINSQRVFPRFVGVAVHEAAHAAHTHFDVPENTTGNIITWVKALEESRAEGKLLEDFPQYIPYVKTIVGTIIAKGFLDDPDTGNEVYDRVAAAHTALLTIARRDIDVFRPDELLEAERVCIQTLGKADYMTLQELWQQAQGLEDGDIESLVEIATAISALVDPENLASPAFGAGMMPCGAAVSGGNDDAQGDGSMQEMPDAGLNDIAFDMGNDAKAAGAQSEQEIRTGTSNSVAPKRDIAKENQERREQINSAANKIQNAKPSNSSSWSYYGGYQPTIVNERPDQKDVSRSRAITDAIKRAQYREVSKTVLNSALPPGRLNIREAMNREAQIASRQPLTATPWKQTRRREVDNPPITLAVSSDISGSMGVYQREVSSFTWAVGMAVKRGGGKVGAVAWNSASYSLIKPGHINQDLIPRFNANGGSSGCPDSIRALDGLMDLSFGEGVRVLTVITDGELPAEGSIQKEINKLHEKGVIVLWVLTQAHGFKPKNATIAVLKSPDEFGKIVGEKIIEALSQA